MIERLIKRIFYEDYWNVGFTNVESSLEIDFENVKWLKSKKKYQFYADPFWIDKNRKIFICETYNYFQGIGKLSIIQMDNNYNIVLEKKIPVYSLHLSYPLIINNEDFYILIPENHYQSKIEAFYLDKNTFDIVKTKVLLNGIKSVDSSFLFHEGFWWMFTNPFPNCDCELKIFKSKDFDSNWELVHDLKFDDKNHRSAGHLFKLNNKIIRPCQNNEETYGGSLIFKEIALLENTYKEQVLTEIYPSQKDYFSDGVHTFNEQGQEIVIDGKKSKVFYFKFLFFFTKKIYKFYFKLKYQL